MTYITAKKHEQGYPMFASGLCRPRARKIRIGGLAAQRGGKEDPMFNSLQEQIRSTEMDKHTIPEQLLRLASVLAISIVVFGAAYLAIMLLD